MSFSSINLKTGTNQLTVYLLSSSIDRFKAPSTGSAPESAVCLACSTVPNLYSMKWNRIKWVYLLTRPRGVTSTHVYFAPRYLRQTLLPGPSFHGLPTSPQNLIPVPTSELHTANNLNILADLPITLSQAALITSNCKLRLVHLLSLSKKVSS